MYVHNLQYHLLAIAALMERDLDECLAAVHDYFDWSCIPVIRSLRNTNNLSRYSSYRSCHVYLLVVN